jgi:ribosomal protein S27AE
MTNDLYHILESDMSSCPTCGKHVHLLCHDSRYAPAFFICFDCRFVGQVGVGKVEFVEPEVSEE